MAALFVGIENFLLRDFFSKKTFQKNYEMDSNQITPEAVRSSLQYLQYKI